MHPVRLTLVILMCFSAFSAGMGLKQALAADASSSAEPAPIVCKWTLAAVEPMVQADPMDIRYGIIDNPQLVANIVAALKVSGEDVPDDVTRVLLVQRHADNGGVVVKYGLETADGCLSDAKVFPLQSPFPAVEHLSGKMGLGTFA